MSNYTSKEIGIISMALKDNPDALNTFFSGLNSGVKNKEYCDHTIINELNTNTDTILEIDLTELYESKTNVAIEFFYSHNFPALQKITMPLYIEEGYLDKLVYNLFREQQVNEFPSLTHIIFHSQGMCEDVLHRIYNHFSLYTKFVRNIPQYSELYGMNASYIFVQNTGIQQKLANSNWLRGFASTKKYKVEYINENPDNCPFIINVSR